MHIIDIYSSHIECHYSTLKKTSSTLKPCNNNKPKIFQFDHFLYPVFMMVSITHLVLCYNADINSLTPI